MEDTMRDFHGRMMNIQPPIDWNEGIGITMRVGYKTGHRDARHAAAAIANEADAEIARLTAERDAATAALAAERERAAKLTDALEWYADEIMAYSVTQMSEPRSAVHADRGRRARAALSESGETPR
jgi:hypothetical protein